MIEAEFVAQVLGVHSVEVGRVGTVVEDADAFGRHIVFAEQPAGVMADREEPVGMTYDEGPRTVIEPLEHRAMRKRFEEQLPTVRRQKDQTWTAQRTN